MHKVERLYNFMNLFLKIQEYLKTKQLKRHISNCVFPYHANYFNCYWDEIIGLGYNCEIGARLIDIFGDNFNHFLFTWSYECDRDLFLKALKELDNFLNEDYTVQPWGMIQNNHYLINFHSRYKKDELFNDDMSLSQIVSVAIEELKSRVNYLAKKLENVFKEKKKVLFIIKLKYTEHSKDIEYIKKLNTLLKKKFNCSNPKYRLLVVISKKNYPNPELLFDNLPTNVFIGIVRSFAPDSNTPNGGDIIGWKKILKKHIECKNTAID